MLISNGSRQCVLKLKEYSNKRNHATRRSQRRLVEPKDVTVDNEQNPTALKVNTAESTSQLTDANEDQSLLGRLLNCKPCRQVTESHQRKLVRDRNCI